MSAIVARFIDGFSPALRKISSGHKATACAIFRKYDLPRLSFTDCTGFALINAHRIDHVFSFDEHFRIFRYNHPVTMFGADQ
jgi:hypothetical protein